MLRAPSWMTSATSTTGSRSRASISSVTIGSPVSALASASRRRPSCPSPWKEYGEERGLYAPPRKRLAPPAATARAAVITWSRDSTVQGPAMSENLSPPILRPSISTTVRSPGRSWADDSLNGLRMGTTWATPSWPSRPRRATCSRSPMAPITVTSSPRDGWARAPQDSIRSMTACTCSSVAVGFITIIMGLQFLLEMGRRVCRWSGARPQGPSSGRRWLRATPAERLAKSPGAVGEGPERIRTPAGRVRSTAQVRGRDSHGSGWFSCTSNRPERPSPLADLHTRTDMPTEGPALRPLSAPRLARPGRRARPSVPFPPHRGRVRLCAALGAAGDRGPGPVSPVLRERARPVESVDDALRAQIGQMRALVEAAMEAGLAANQVGMLNRVFVYRVEPDTPARALVNPEIDWADGEQAAAEEGCLSIPGIWIEVVRPVAVRVRALGDDGAPVVLEAAGHEARVIQHELDHLDGVLTLDRTTPELRKAALRELR